MNINKSINQLEKSFKEILCNHLEDIGTLEDMQSVYVIPEIAIKNIVEELILKVIGGD